MSVWPFWGGGIETLNLFVFKRISNDSAMFGTESKCWGCIFRSSADKKKAMESAPKTLSSSSRHSSFHINRTVFHQFDIRNPKAPSHILPGFWGPFGRGIPSHPRKWHSRPPSSFGGLPELPEHILQLAQSLRMWWLSWPGNGPGKSYDRECFPQLTGSSGNM